MALIEVFLRARECIRAKGIMGNSVTQRYKFLISLKICGFCNGWRRLAAAGPANRNKEMGK